MDERRRVKTLGRSPYENPRPTLMRPPFVKRQTPSRSGFFAVFFRLFPLARSASGLVG
jgi:hypothetical protein